ncbi:hypothetical protein PMAYCL1PPCAC_15295, partial [Pristionchus mayeri]
AISILLFEYVVWKSNALHVNMKILNTYAILVLGGINMLTRVFFVIIELGAIHFEDLADLIVPVHLVKYSAWLGIYHYVVYSTAERYAAFHYAADYENKRRIWISAVLILMNTLITVPIALLMIQDILNGAAYSAAVCV